MWRAAASVLVDFWAPWCGPRRQMAPAFAQAAREAEPRVRLWRSTPKTSRPLRRVAPSAASTMILFQQGREVARISGAMGAADIVRWVRTLVGLIGNDLAGLNVLGRKLR